MGTIVVIDVVALIADELGGSLEFWLVAGSKSYVQGRDRWVRQPSCMGTEAPGGVGRCVGMCGDGGKAERAPTHAEPWSRRQ